MSRSCQSRSCCLLDVLEIVIDSVMDPTFHMTMSHRGDTQSYLASLPVCKRGKMTLKDGKNMAIVA